MFTAEMGSLQSTDYSRRHKLYVEVMKIGAVQKLELRELLRLFFYFSYDSRFNTVIRNTGFRFL